ncbi:hypothetical protein PL9631_1020094 [Planktothrix paucivesiculata PCC 9631]|uniref:Uncharacterized protein n=1 Tax=Planktothrix paucivesiculata PCC 9631 TaxID=671071 RepID=A0A7Z9BEY8_9CYAN|nr:hypothetical protein PL9631_1020094 [Planktothrix paucivesiculata PCC 9631]
MLLIFACLIMFLGVLITEEGIFSIIDLITGLHLPNSIGLVVLLVLLSWCLED